MANNDRKDYVLECLKRYCEQHGVTAGVSVDSIGGWLPIIREALEEMGLYDYTPEEVFDVLLTTFCARVIPYDDRSEELKKLICEYCLKWSEMSPDGQADKVLRPPYVMNGSKLSCTVSYKDKKYSFKKIDRQKMKFIREEGNKKETLNVAVEKNDSSITFKVEGTSDKVNPKFKSSGGTTLYLADIDGFGRESVWFFDEGNYVERGNLIGINKHLENRYKKENCSTWRTTVKNDFASCMNGKGKYSAFVRPARDYQTYGFEDLGKAHPDTIRHYLNDHCADMSAKDMQATLEKYCIGIDCSGFVSRAISYVMEHMDDGLDIDGNYRVQVKTVGPICDASKNKVTDEILSRKKNWLNNAATYFKLYHAKSDLDKDNVYKTDDEDFTSLDLIGSKLIFLFSKEKNNLQCEKINHTINPSGQPEITSLRPGDIITMADDVKFENGFHIAIICDVGVDMDGPFFITADSSPKRLDATAKDINGRKDKSSYAVLKRPDSKEKLDEKNLSINQEGTGVRYLLHRGFVFFNNKPYLAFRRPYAFDRYYRDVK